MPARSRHAAKSPAANEPPLRRDCSTSTPASRLTALTITRRSTVSVRQRPDQDGLHDGKHRRRDADAERECAQHGQRERPGLAGRFETQTG